MNIYMSPDAIMAAAKQNDANTAQALEEAKSAVNNLRSFRDAQVFGTSPAGKSTGGVLDKVLGIIDETITNMDQAITVLSQNLHASVDLVVRSQDTAGVDYSKLTQDNRSHVQDMSSAGIEPGDKNYVNPRSGTNAGDPSGTGAGPAGSGSSG